MTKLITSKHIEDFDLAQFAQAEDANLLAESLELWRYQHWFMPQLVHLFSTWKFDPKQPNCEQVARDNCVNNPRNQGAWILANRVKRGLLVKNQLRPENSSYGAIVPLILSAFKRYHRVPYESWRAHGNIHQLVDKNLADAMLAEVPTLSRDELIQLRTFGLTAQTGARAGQLKSTTSTWKLANMRNTALEGVPTLAQTILTQIWLAHPAIRTEYMILSLDNWDYLPEPLETAEIFEKPATTPQKDLLPWQ